MYRILAIHRYYWPDTPPYAALLRSIVEQWHRDGHSVDVLASQPSYKPEIDLERRPRTEVIDHATVRRIYMQPDRSGRLRHFVNTIWFPLVVGFRVLLGRRYDVVMCSTAPPVLLAAAVSIASRLRGARFVYHCMDLHPEIGALSGEFAHPWVYSLMLRIDTATCRRAAAVVVLSTDMRAALMRRDARLASRIVVLNNFEVPSFDEPADLASPLPAQCDRLRIVFTGNLGRFQGLDVVTEAVLAGDRKLDRIQLVFMGEGAAKTQLENLVRAAPVSLRGRVQFVPHGTTDQARALLRTADLGLVSLTPSVIRFAYPSKTATYLSEGVPLLVAVEKDSELAAMVANEAVGRHVPMDDEGGIRSALVELLERRAELPLMAVRAKKVWAREFSAEVQLAKWSQLLQRVSGGLQR